MGKIAVCSCKHATRRASTRRRRSLRAALLIWVLAAALPATLVAAGTGAGPASWTGDLTPITRSDWTYDRAAHLMERAGFGGTPREIEAIAAMRPAAAVARLVRYGAIDNSGIAGFDHSGIFDPGMDPFPKSRAEAVRIAREKGAALGVEVLPDGSARPLQPVVDKFFYGLRADRLEAARLGQWWAQRMLATARPLEEKLTFFWHGHFATSDNKVRDYRMMLVQNEMLRSHANGNFRDLLMGIMKDPAMLVFLDNGENVKDHPNENFGRELLELFTMGVGNYSERDIREASRAFTGWTNDVLDFHFDAELHDFGEKEFLGRKGSFDGDDIIDIILDEPATAKHIARKVYRFFVSDEIVEPALAGLAKHLRESDYELAPLLETIFLSRDFYSPTAFATQIKSPVQLVISTYRRVGLDTLPTVPDFNSLTGSLGQRLFHPPNVAGWAQGRSWITPATLLQRGNLTREILFPPDLEAFGAPDRRMPGIYRQVGARIAEGANITTATQVGDAASNMLADADEDYNTRFGGYRGYLMAYERVKQIPRHIADLDLHLMMRQAGVESSADAVDHLARRFLLVPLASETREALIEFLEVRLEGGELGASPATEEALRGLLYLVLSTPEYQLG
ncbi:MAG: DUF1800 domain-containing protein [Acidobacteriota bacterium]|nr:DUF1800 domain-containing protein [Acidobacteriota bacterium]